MATLEEARRAIGKAFTTPVIKVLQRTRVSPDFLTWCGLMVAVAAGIVAATGHLFAAGWVVAFSGVFDMLDGALARAKGQTTKFGGVLDSTLDRVSDAAPIVGLLIVYAQQPSVAGIAIAGVCLVGSQLPSYIRARAEGLGIRCDTGIFTRPERVVILALGLLLSHFGPVLLIAVAVIAALSWITAGQRLFYVWRKTKAG